MREIQIGDQFYHPNYKALYTVTQSNTVYGYQFNVSMFNAAGQTLLMTDSFFKSSVERMISSRVWIPYGQYLQEKFIKDYIDAA